MLDAIVNRAKEGLDAGIRGVLKRDRQDAKESNAGTPPPPLPKKSRLTDMGHQRLVDHVNEFDAYLPLLERAGFELRRFEIEVGLSPKFIPRFMIRRLISEEEKKRLLEEAGSKHLLKMILDALFKASYLSKHVKVGALEFLGLEIHVGAVPRVRLLFGDVREYSSSQVD